MSLLFLKLRICVEQPLGCLLYTFCPVGLTLVPFGVLLSLKSQPERKQPVSGFILLSLPQEIKENSSLNALMPGQALVDCLLLPLYLCSALTIRGLVNLTVCM